LRLLLRGASSGHSHQALADQDGSPATRRTQSALAHHNAARAAQEKYITGREAIRLPGLAIMGGIEKLVISIGPLTAHHIPKSQDQDLDIEPKRVVLNVI
jgi:hypothetical protein